MVNSIISASDLHAHDALAHLPIKLEPHHDYHVLLSSILHYPYIYYYRQIQLYLFIYVYYVLEERFVT